MSVGTDPMTCFSGEDVEWEFDLVDPNVTDISTGWTILLVIKLLDSSPDPPLIGPITCTFGALNSLKYFAKFKVDLDAGSYTVATRRTTSGHSWQTTQAPLTIKASASQPN